MKISIRDFAPIKDADFELNGLTVIAGDNDTGKSTVGKLAFSTIKAANRGLATNADARASNILFRTHLNLVFGRDKRQGIVQLFSSDNVNVLSAGIDGRGNVSDFRVVRSLPFADALLIETPVVWQLFDTFQGATAYNADPSSEVLPKINFPYTLYNVYRCMNGSVPGAAEIHESVIDIISEIVNGKLVFTEGQPVFLRDEVEYPMQSVATGIQSFVLIQRILELGLAEPKRLLILDEPEVHLHPKWQLQYAKLLVSMVEQYGMTVLLTSHSSVFVETLDYVGKKRLGDKCKFYLSERGEDDTVTMRDVSDDLEPIYEKLAHPLIQLSLFQGDA